MKTAAEAQDQNRSGSRSLQGILVDMTLPVRPRFQMYQQLVSLGALLARKRFCPPSTRVLLYALLVVLAFEMRPDGFAGARADERPEALYPGRYAANCKQAPIVGCVCDTDTLGQVSIFPQTASEGRTSADRVQEAERLRMIDWVRRTCMALTQPTNPR
jgi:hypothetical protein